MKNRIILLYGKDEIYDNPLALEYLRAYCSQDLELSSKADFEILTFESHEESIGIAERVLSLTPCLVAASCYVWNTDKTLAVCDHLKRVNPSIYIVLGGPEVGHISEEVCASNPFVDIIVSGEGEETFRQLLRAYLAGIPLSSLAGTTLRGSSGLIKENGRPALELSSLPHLFQDSTEDLSSQFRNVLFLPT